MVIEIIANYFPYGLKIMSRNTLSAPQPDSASNVLNSNICIKLVHSIESIIFSQFKDLNQILILIKKRKESADLTEYLSKVFWYFRPIALLGQKQQFAVSSIQSYINVLH